MQILLIQEKCHLSMKRLLKAYNQNVKLTVVMISQYSIFSAACDWLS